jgi:hypothetical protein
MNGGKNMQEQIVQAKTSQRLLAKADRLFTGTLEGRIIELLQNARRADATRVEITNSPNGLVTIQDNGHGIRDFSILLDLGSSDWDPTIEEAEDPAGVGIFSLAPRDVTIDTLLEVLHQSRKLQCQLEMVGALSQIGLWF